MEAEEKFVAIAGLICEPARAKMLWNLLDGRAYTATELSAAADISTNSASNHLAKLLAANIVKFEMQGRHRYYSFAKPEIAYAVESLANLANENSPSVTKQEKTVSGMKYCRTCYDHLAGFVAVKIVESLEEKDILQKNGTGYAVTENGWEWFAEFDISDADFNHTRRPLTRQCLDWSERRPHLAGQLGALFLEKMLHRKWFKKIQFSRELEITPKGQREIYQLLDVVL
jgi:DNA-binding transcriptional ArsR family regulator